MNLKNVRELGLKELFSLRSDPVLMLLIVYIFSIAVYSVANGVDYDVDNAAVAVVDEDQSALSRNITAALLPPQFKTPQEIAAACAVSGNVLITPSFIMYLQASASAT